MAFVEMKKPESCEKSSLQSEKDLCEFDNFGDNIAEKKLFTNDVYEDSVQGKISPDLMSETVAFQKKDHDEIRESANDLYRKNIIDMTYENEEKPQGKNEVFHDHVLSEIKTAVFPVPQEPLIKNFSNDDTSYNDNDIINAGAVKKSTSDDWNLLENTAPVKPLPPLPREFESKQVDEEFLSFNEFTPSKMSYNPSELIDEAQDIYQKPGNIINTGESKFEDETQPLPTKMTIKPAVPQHAQSDEMNENHCHLMKKKLEDEIAPRKIFSDMGLDAWFNPERLNPAVAALIYWRDPEHTGIVFGAIVGFLLSLACFSLISVFSYAALATLMLTMGFRIYKTIMQAVQKTSDGHPFKDILEIDLTLPAEKVHEFADVAVAHVNAAVSELRRLFLIEDFVDSLKFTVLMWCLTYVGSWFNGMTLITLGVVALFTLPKVYETNKAQIDQNLALVHGKINDLTAKVKAAIPLGKKAEPTKEE